ncbi:MAG: cell surface protein SprA, partial [Bacteroidia bacterium]|nr:cell surface protein SprA [Bacteroidia bacterium]
MKTYNKLFIGILVPVLMLTAIWSSKGTTYNTETIASPFLAVAADTSKKDSLRYPFTEEQTDRLNLHKSKFYLKDPDNIKTTIELNPETNEYDVKQTIGNMNYRPPSYMTLEEYQEEEFKKALLKNWRDRMASDDKGKKKSFQPRINIPGELGDKIGPIDIRPQGSAELIFGGNFMRTQNPALPIRQQKVGAFNFQQKIQMNVVGKIGDKIQLQTNYNTETGFSFDNKVNLKYEGKEDEIVQLVEAGNVNLPLTGSLITGSQSLMGIKTKLKFGKLTATTIVSQQQGDRKSITVQGGAQTTPIDISAANYDANRHYFLSQFFKDQYDRSMASLPNVTSPFNVTRVEVYITNRTYATTNVRNIAAFADMG